MRLSESHDHHDAPFISTTRQSPHKTPSDEAGQPPKSLKKVLSCNRSFQKLYLLSMLYFPETVWLGNYEKAPHIIKMSSIAGDNPCMQTLSSMVFFFQVDKRMIAIPLVNMEIFSWVAS
jgi:hypothetical protein